MQPLPRRSFLAGGLAAGSLLLVACGSGEDDPVTFLIPTFPDGFRQQAVLVAGVSQRIAFVVADEIDNLRENAPATLEVTVTADGVTVFEGTLDQRVDGIITPYFPTTLTFDAPGSYRASLPDRPDVAPVDFLVVDRSEVEIPQVGDPLPAVQTPTTTDPMGVTPLCTRAIPCPFHELDLADVVANGRPTVLLVATPGFCQTDICGPVVDLLIDVGETRTDLDLIHCEVYVDPSEFAGGGFPDLVPAVDALALPYEPALFVADGAGTIIARLDTTFDRSELTEVLDLV